MQDPLTHEAKASVNPMLRLGVVAAIGLAAIGCNNQETAEAQTAAPAAPVAPPAGIAVSPVNDPSEILASFGETKLTRGDIEQEVTMRMASMRERVPAVSVISTASRSPATISPRLERTRSASWPSPSATD